MGRKSFFVGDAGIKYTLRGVGLGISFEEEATETSSVSYIRERFGSEIIVPASLFNSELTPLQIAVKYCKEVRKLSNTQTSNLLGRDIHTIWSTYRAVEKKTLPRLPNIGPSVPLSILNDPVLSAMESVVVFLKNAGLTFAQISKLIGRDQRTIWAVNRRSEKKAQGRK